jgi:hypothetical protein
MTEFEIKSREGKNAAIKRRNLEDGLSSLEIAQKSIAAILEARKSVDDAKAVSNATRLEGIECRISNIENALGVLLNLADVLIRKKAAISTDDIADAGATYDQDHVQTLVDMTNELKEKVNSMNE